MAASAEEPRTREIYVPFSDLNVLLQNQPKRVLIGREEYDALMKKAKRMPKTDAPLPAAVTAADYKIATDRQRAEIVGELTVDVMQEGLHALPLDLGGVGLRSARLDDRAASIGRAADGRPVLFVEGVGGHRLKLEMTAPLETTAARQVLNYRLPRPPAATLRLEVPGDVEIKGGAAVISRVVTTASKGLPKKGATAGLSSSAEESPSETTAGQASGGTPEAAKVTRFELLPQPGDVSLLMTLNSHLHRQERAVVARSVVLDEVADACEKLRATVTLSILHRAVDRFRFVVPEGFEITDVSSPLLARWEVVSEDGRRVLDARLREQTTETVTLGITAIRAPAKLEGWTAPRLVPLDVVGDVAVLGLLVDERLKAESLSAEGLIPLDTSVLGGASPPNNTGKASATPVPSAAGSAGAVRAVAAWYAPQGEYALSARFVRPKAEMDAGASLLLVVSDKGLEMDGGISLMPRVEKRFSFDFSVPAGWQVTSVTTAAGKPLPFEFYPAAGDHISPLPLGEGQGVRDERGSDSTSERTANGPHPNPLPKGEGTDGKTLPKGAGTDRTADGPHPNPLPKGEGTGVAGRVRVTVDGGIEVGRPFRTVFHAVYTPRDWLSDWRKTKIEFPHFAVLDAANSEAAVAVEPRDDMTVRPETLVGLTTLGAEEERGFGLTDVPAVLAYRCRQSDFALALAVERTEPRTTARTFSFLRVDRDALHCRYEINYTIEQSRVRQLVFSLPKDTPDAISIVGLDDVKVKEFSDAVSGGRRRWTVSLAEPRRDRVRLAVDFQQRLPAAEPKGYRLPIVEAEGVAYQTGLAAVEGCAELEVNVDAKEFVATSTRQVDVGELAEADYQPGRRLLGAYEFVGNPPPVTIDVLRRPGYGIPPAIVQKCELDTVLAPDGRSRTRAAFELLSKESYLQVELPAGAKLWAAELDGVPLKPQRDARGVLIDLSAGKGAALKRLQITFADDRPQPVALRGDVRVYAPKLLLHANVGQFAGTGPFFGEKTDSAKKTSAENMDLSPSAAAFAVPLADFVWRLHLPSGYEVVRAGGTLSTGDVERPTPAAFQLAKELYNWTGGVRGPCGLPLPTGGCGRSVYRCAPFCEQSVADNRRGLTAPGSSTQQPPELQFVGRVTGMKDCRWTDPQTYSYMGASVPLGRKYAISSGMMEIAYKDGARTIMEGPVSYEVESPNGGYLSLGKITARTDAQRGPYSLRTPTAVITCDPGSEVGIEVSENGDTLAHAYSGPARMKSLGNGKELELTPGQFFQVGTGKDVEPGSVAFNVSPRFTRQLAERPDARAKTDVVPGGDGKGGGRDKYASVDLSEKSEAEKKIEAALKSPAHLDFTETPLKDVIEYLKDQYKIEIQFDNKAMSDLGIATDTPVTKSLKGVSLRSALRLILREIGLTYQIEDEVLLITTPEEAESRLTTVVYPVADLVEFRDKSGETWTDFDSFIDLITSTVKPTTWDEVGGPGTIAPQSIGNTHAIVASQTQEVHREIAKVLEVMRKVARTQATDGKPPLRERPEFLAGKGENIGGMGGAAGGMYSGRGAGGGMGGMPGLTAKKSAEKAPAKTPAEMPAAETKPESPAIAGEPLLDSTVKHKDHKKAVGMDKPGVFNADVDIDFDADVDIDFDKDDEKGKEILDARRKAAIAALESVESVEKSSIPNIDEPPVVYPDAETWKTLTAQRKEKSKAARELAGVRSLKIDLLQSPDDGDRVVEFRSLGVDPLLAVTLADDSRLARLRLGLALAVLLAGAALTCRPVRSKTGYVLAVMLATTVFSLVGDVELAKACNAMFFAAAWLVPYYLTAGILRWLRRTCCPCCRAAKTVAAVVMLIALTCASFAQAAERDANPQAADGPIIVQIAKPPAPVDLPKDAIILPYDPEWKNGIKDADKLLVPYEKYVELWNRAYPDKKIETKAPPAPYALADASYKTVLEDGDSLLLAGQMEIDVFADGYVQVPLGLGGGVLTRAELDGKPARISVLATPPAIERKNVKSDEQSPFKIVEQSSASPFVDPPRAPDRSVVVLHVAGKGRHKLELAARLKLDRQGGWRAVEGVLPSAPAAALDIVVPTAKTELRLGQVADCRQFETDKPDQTIRTALGENGALAVRWRPEVAAGQIDRTLTAASDAVFDVRDDGLRLTWRLTLEFRRSERDGFSVKLPDGYLLEKIDGPNVRGWEVRAGEGGRTVGVSLLQAAKEREQFTLLLWRAGRVGQGDLTRFDAPVVAVADAALQSGRLTVRRGPLIELRTIDRSGATRIDLPADMTSSGATAGLPSSGGKDTQGTTAGQASSGTLPANIENVLGVRPFESYSFAAVPFTVRLEAAEVKARVSAKVESILKLAENQRNLESRIRFDVRGRRVYRLRVLLPEDLSLAGVVAPGAHQYTVTKEGRRQLLTVYPASGQEGEVALVVSGKLAAPRSDSQREIPLPRLTVLDVDSQQGDVAVQADPAFDVEAVDLSGCETMLLGRLSAWLNPDQREAARLALHYAAGDYAGKLRLKPRTPEVVCDTITNVRVTDRALLETILLDFNVARAGVRRIEFLLPEAMADSRFSVPLLQQQSVEPAGGKYPGMVRVRLDLQEETMGQIRVVVENDRLLTPGAHQAPIPTIVTEAIESQVENVGTVKRPATAVAGGHITASSTPPEAAGGRLSKISDLGVNKPAKGDSPLVAPVPVFRTNRRYAVIENTGRAEVVVDQKELRGMDVLDRHGKDWTALTGFLGDKITMAYLVSPDAERPRLSFRAESHDAVKNVQAAIGMSDTTLVVDAAGAYRAEVVLRVNNATEQYLDVRLPDGATLWTARVAGEPVKPTLTAVGGDSGRRNGLADNRRRESPPTVVRIPLIKTAPGDLAFPVVLRYGGRMPPLATIGVAEFPMIRCENITPQRSNAKLYLPERFRWFDFGGEMQLTDEAGLKAGEVQYQSSQVSQIGLALQEGDKFAKARATANLRLLPSPYYMSDDVQYHSPQSKSNSELQAALSLNASIMQKTQAEAARQEQSPATTPTEDNRQRLNEAYQGQTLGRAKNVVGNLGKNWGSPTIDRLPYNNNAYGSPAMGRQTQSLMMSVTPRIVIQEEEEEKLDVQYPPPNPPQTGEPSLGASSIRGYQTLGRNYNRNRWGDDGRQSQQAAEDENLNRYQQRLAGPTNAGAEYRGKEQSFRDQRTAEPGLGQPSKPGELPAPPPGWDPYADPVVQPSPPAATPAPVIYDPALAESKPTQPSGALSAYDATVSAGVKWESEKRSGPKSAGLASLDVELPTRGLVYSFTTPRGEQRITARYVSGEATRRLSELAIVGFAVVVLWVIVAMARRGGFDWLARPSGSWLLVVLGLLALVCVVLPWAGLALIVLGFGLKIRRLTQ